MHQWVDPPVFNVMEIREMLQRVVKKLRRYIRLALGRNPMTAALGTLTAPVEKGGRGLIHIEMYATCHVGTPEANGEVCERGVVSYGTYSVKCSYPPFKEFCRREGIHVSAENLPWITLATRTDIQDSVLAQSLRPYPRYRQAVSGIEQETPQMGQVPLQQDTLRHSTTGLPLDQVAPDEGYQANAVDPMALGQCEVVMCGAMGQEC